MVDSKSSLAAEADQVKAVLFDFMGTCLDWHSSIAKAFPHRIPYRSRADLVSAWRQAFFDDIHARFEQKLPPEDIDSSHARLLAHLLSKDSNFSALDLTHEEQAAAVSAWHHMRPWADVPDGLRRLRGKFEVFVLANGTTRLQLDLARSSGLDFDMLFSSQLLQHTKPEPNIYLKALELIGSRPDEAVMVAAHAYDLRAAKAVGMRTVYIQRTTEDPQESMEQIRSEVDAFVDGREATESGGLGEVARLLGAGP